MVITFQRQEPAPRVVLASAVALMVHYFDIREVDAWTEVINLAACNPPSWIRIAVIEALYQGRYKVVSVQQILDIWQRRGRILSHFNREFEAIVTVPLPDRVQAQLRALAEEHQEEHRQQRLREHPEPGTKIISDQEPPDQGEESIQISPEDRESRNADPAIVAPEPQAIADSLESSTVDHPEESLAEKDLAVPSLPEEQEQPAQPNQSAENVSREAVTDLGDPSQPSTSSPAVSEKIQTEWVPALRRSSSSVRIDRFCPLPDRSGFDRKLLALANQP
ncbi:MAG: hypothetical protein ACO37W_09240 [Prochlorotrichaceae cyanobacterium]